LRDAFSIGPDEQEFWAIYDVDARDKFGLAGAIPSMIQPDESHEKTFRHDVTHWGRVSYRVQSARAEGSGRGRYWLRMEFDFTGSATERDAFEEHCRSVHFPRLLQHPQVHRVWQLEAMQSISQLGTDPAGQFMHVVELDSPSVVTESPFPNLAAWEDGAASEHVTPRALHFAELLLDLPG
jgi:hypothetical protein